MLELKSEFLVDTKVDVDWAGAINVGVTPQGNRAIIYVTGGTFEGPKLKGVVLPGGGDWYTVRPDGTGILDVRALARTDDDHIIYTYYRGINYTPPEVRERMNKGENVDPSENYFRITPVFETASEKYSWLNRIVAVGVGQMTPAGVTYKIYTIL
ncbi:MAG TPA: DUF3237 domain-containing protein [Dehalococcoidia bacterium]|nr:DUF3237 domain-containing protein [Dehalococcoidia bacterium]